MIRSLSEKKEKNQLQYKYKPANLPLKIDKPLNYDKGLLLGDLLCTKTVT